LVVAPPAQALPVDRVAAQNCDVEILVRVPLLLQLLRRSFDLLVLAVEQLRGGSLVEDVLEANWAVQLA